jgi:hypothetical protein
VRCKHFFVVLSGLVAVALLAADASATYHPTLGRWLQRDPIGYADGMGLYEYVSTSPVAACDPHGLFRSGDWGQAQASSPEAAAGWLGIGADLQRWWSGWTYASDAMDQWLEGKGGVYRGNEQMAQDLGNSSVIRSAMENDIKGKIADHVTIEVCGGVQDVTVPVSITSGVVLSGQLEATARVPDRIDCQALLQVVLICGDGGCCRQYDFMGSATCTLADRLDFHDPESKGFKEAYKGKSWLKKLALGHAWRAQQGLGMPGMDIVVDFGVENLEGTAPCARK